MGREPVAALVEDVCCASAELGGAERDLLDDGSALGIADTIELIAQLPAELVDQDGVAIAGRDAVVAKASVLEAQTQPELDSATVRVAGIGGFISPLFSPEGKLAEAERARDIPAMQQAGELRGLRPVQLLRDRGEITMTNLVEPVGVERAHAMILPCRRASQV